MIRHMSIVCSLLLAGILLIAGCGTDTKTEYIQGTTPDSTYLVEYIPGMMSAAEGKTTFQLRVRNRSNSSPATGLAITLSPLMYMANGMNHATPVDVVAESGTPGTYNCTIYYLMGSGTGMGYWELQVGIGSESTTFYPSVGMAMGSDTVKKTLYGQTDVVSSASGTVLNSYYLFRDGAVSSPTSTFTLFIARAENNKMTFRATSAVSSPTGTVASAVATASTDSLFPASSATVSGTDLGNGHWSFAGMTGLASASTNTVYVKLNVNGEDKTTDGAAVSGTNDRAIFTLTLP